MVLHKDRLLFVVAVHAAMGVCVCVCGKRDGGLIAWDGRASLSLSLCVCPHLLDEVGVAGVVEEARHVPVPLSIDGEACLCVFCACMCMCMCVAVAVAVVRRRIRKTGEAAAHSYSPMSCTPSFPSFPAHPPTHSPISFRSHSSRVRSSTISACRCRASARQCKGRHTRGRTQKRRPPS